MSNPTPHVKKMIPCAWITCRGRTFILRPEEIESMRLSMDQAGFAGEYKISDGEILAVELSQELTRRDIAMISNML